MLQTTTARRASGLLEQYVAHGAAGRAAFGNNDFRRGPVNVAVIPLFLFFAPRARLNSMGSANTCCEPENRQNHR